jgi:hypothetical protein
MLMHASSTRVVNLRWPLAANQSTDIIENCGNLLLDGGVCLCSCRHTDAPDLQTTETPEDLQLCTRIDTILID